MLSTRYAFRCLDIREVAIHLRLVAGASEVRSSTLDHYRFRPSRHDLEHAQVTRRNSPVMSLHFSDGS